jgi:hypothetical protein
VSKKSKRTYAEPASVKLKPVPKRTAVLIASGDLRESANTVCWPAQQALEAEANKAFEDLGWKLLRANPSAGDTPHGFIASQAQGREVFANIHPDAPLVVLSGTFDAKEVVAVLRAGANGYVLNTLTCQALIKSFDLAMCGQTVLPSEFARAIRAQRYASPEILAPATRPQVVSAPSMRPWGF